MHVLACDSGYRPESGKQNVKQVTLLIDVFRVSQVVVVGGISANRKAEILQHVIWHTAQPQNL